MDSLPAELPRKPCGIILWTNQSLSPCLSSEESSKSGSKLFTWRFRSQARWVSYSVLSRPEEGREQVWGSQSTGVGVLGLTILGPGSEEGMSLLSRKEPYESLPTDICPHTDCSRSGKRSGPEGVTATCVNWGLRPHLGLWGMRTSPSPQHLGCVEVNPAPKERRWHWITRDASSSKWRLEIDSEFQFSSVAQLCLTLCHPMDCSTPGFPVLHRLPEFVQTRVRWVSDAIQTSHPLSLPHLRKIVLGLPWWSSGKESTFKCRGCGFNPWLRNWNPTRCRATKPAYHNYWTWMLLSLFSATGESLYATTKT